MTSGTADPPADDGPDAPDGRPDPPVGDAHDALAESVRTEGTRIIATLVRTVGDLRLAEDAVQEAAVRALRDWPRTGVPEQPRAWLTVTARRVAIDLLRRESARAGKERAADLLLPDNLPESTVQDDQLRLIFTCCHPAIGLEAQVTLALRVLCGLQPAQIASVLQSTEAAVAKRLTRTRTKIARAGIPYRIPAEEELPARLAAVCAVVHGSYTAAHSRPAGSDAVRDVDGCREALRLARSVHALMPDEAMPAAVLALLLLTEARAATRLDPHGDPVPLAEQDRTRWDRAMVAEGVRLLNASLRRSGAVADPYQLQAAIAAEHSLAPTYAGTDWREVVRLYDLLLSVRPTPAAQLARAVAVAEAHGPHAGLDALDRISPSAAGHRWHAVRGELLARAGRHAEAVTETLASLTPDVSEPERRYRRRCVARWSALVGPAR